MTEVIPYNYRVEVTNRVKGLALIDRVPEELWMKFMTLYRRQGSRPSPQKRNAKWLSEEALQTAEKRRELKDKGEIYPFECRVPKNSKER